MFTFSVLSWVWHPSHLHLLIAVLIQLCNTIGPSLLPSKPEWRGQPVGPVSYSCIFPLGRIHAENDRKLDYGKICLSNGSFCIWKFRHLWSIALLIWPIFSDNFLTVIFPWHLPFPPSATFVLQFSLLLSPLFLFFFSSCHLNFLSSYQVWSDFHFCHKGVLELLQAIWSKSEIDVWAVGLLSCQAPLPLPLGDWECLSLTSQSFLVTLFL